MANVRIPWFAPITDQAEKALVNQVLDSQYLNDGKVTRELERRVAELVGVKHCVAVTSGTSALTLCLMAKGIGHGDEVIIPDLTFIATANAVRLAGAEPVLVDVRRDRFDMDADAAKKAITSKTRAIIPVDVNGRGADYHALTALCREKNLALITDSAEALGSKWKGRYLGSFGDAGIFSFSANKTVTTGQGGMIATNDTTMYHRLLELKDQGRRAQGTGGDDFHPVMGFNFKLTNLQAAVGLAQMDKLQARLAQAGRRDRWYKEGLAGVPGVKIPANDDAGGEVRQWMDIVVSNSLRQKIIAAFDEKGIGCRAFWFPLHRQEPYKAADSEFPNTISISETGIWLPSSFSLSQKEAEETINVIREIAYGRPNPYKFAKQEEVNQVPADLSNKTLSILLPVRNEGMSLRVMLKLLDAALDVTHEILVVYDFPEDDSIPVVQELQKKNPNIRLVKNDMGPGVVNAVRAGVYASTGKYILIFAADEVGPVVAIDEMLAHLENGADFVSCTRYAKGGRRLGGSFIGGILSRTANKVFHFMVRSQFTDSTTGIKMFRKSVFESFRLEARPIGWAFAFEMAIKAEALGMKCAETPIISVDRLFGGVSSFKLKPWVFEYLRWFVWGMFHIKRSPDRTSKIADSSAR
jgi:dTDP-4-amino-4,6-dideoxygalactose transaminase